jgi:DNA-binding MarR family transcriptional regulator
MHQDTLTEDEWQPLLESMDLSSSPGHVFRALENKIHERYYELTPRPDISPRQTAVLLKLFQVGQATQTELAKLIALDRSTLSEMSSRMTRNGLLERSVPHHDRRATSLRITAAGKEALFATAPPVMRAQEELMSSLPAELRPVFERCLRLLYDVNIRRLLNGNAVGDDRSLSGDPKVTRGKNGSRRKRSA